MTDPYRRDRWLGRALTAFPPRWREVHGEEFLDVCRSLGGAEPDERPSAKQLIDIVVGGWRVRHRDRPRYIDRLSYTDGLKVAPRRWHLWRRDQINSRFPNLTTTAPLIAIQWFQPSWFFALLIVVMLVAPFVPRKKARAKTRRKFEEQIGYAIFSGQQPPPPPPPKRPVWIAPPRLPIRPVGTASGLWLLGSGLALLGGAALGNPATRTIGPLSFVPDQNSPLTGVGVLAWLAAGLAGGLISAIVVTIAVKHSRTRIQPETIYPVGQRAGTTLTTISGVAGAGCMIIGFGGILPDLACAIVGTVFLTLGGAVLALTFCVARWSDDLGRQLTFGDLIFGEIGPPPGAIVIARPNAT